MAHTYDAKRYRRHLWGWLCYAFASEVFVIVSLTLFLPICLEQFARDNGFFLPSKTTPCTSPPSPPPSPTSPNSSSLVVEDDRRCVVKLGWVWVDSASFSLYVNSISVALQALTVISMGNIADHPPHRKPLLLTFATLGSTSATLFLLLPSSSPLWPLSALLGILANVGFGASVVAMNAYLPGLARESRGVLERRLALERACERDGDGDGDEEEGERSSEEPLLSTTTTTSPGPTPESQHIESLRTAYTTSLSRATSRISSLGIALGYTAGILLLLVALVPVTLLHGSTFALRLAIGMSGVWWAVGSVPAGVWLPSSSSFSSSANGSGSSRSGRGGEEEDGWEGGEEEGEGGKREWSAGREVVGAWKRLGGMLRWREVKRLRNTFQYLAAWFLLSDGFTTITSTAILFAKTTLHMPASSLILIGVLTPVSGILGSLLWPPLQRRFGWSNLRVLVTLVCLASLVPAYGCLGFLKVFREGGFGGLTTPGEVFGLAVYFGSVYGAFQGYARAFYSELIPHGEEARWYALFSITDKSSSFVGPLVVGLIADTTGNIRYAFFFLVVMVWAAVPVLVSIDVERGRRDAGRYRYRA